MIKPTKGQFVFQVLVLATVHLRKKFEVISFICSTDRRGSKFKKWVS